MPEERFRTLAPDQWDPEQRRLAAALEAGPRGSVRGPYVPLIHSPELADRMRHLGDFIRFEGALAPRLKEILVFTVARRWGAAFMAAVHRAQAPEKGVPAALVDALLAGKPDGLSAAEAAAQAMAVELLDRAAVSDATFAAARRHFDERALIELVTFVGYYTTLAMVLNTAQVPAP